MWPFKSRVKKPIYHGDGLYQLPEQAADRDDYSGQLLTEWATQQWSMWEAGRALYMINPDDPRKLCPTCYEVHSLEQNQFLSQRTQTQDDRDRWARHAAKSERKLKLLGPCRCGHQLTAGQAASDVHNELGKYYR